MAEEYIEREAATQYFKERSKDFIGHEPIPPALVIMGCANELDAIPAADVRPVVRGHWEFHLAPLALKCAACHKKIAYKYAVESNFCPNCGADMQEEIEDNG